MMRPAAGSVLTKISKKFFERARSTEQFFAARILDGEREFEHDSQNPARTYMVLSACVGLCRRRTEHPNAQAQAYFDAQRSRRIDALWELLDKLADSTILMVVPIVHEMIREKLHHTD